MPALQNGDRRGVFSSQRPIAGVSTPASTPVRRRRRRRPILQNDISTGSDLISKLLAKTKLDDICPNGAGTEPSSSDQSATSADDEDFLVVLEEILACSVQAGSTRQLDDRQTEAIAAAVDGIRRLRLFLCIGDYTRLVCRRLQRAYASDVPDVLGPSVQQMCEDILPEQLLQCVNRANAMYPGPSLTAEVATLSLHLYQERNDMVHSGLGKDGVKGKSALIKAMVENDKKRLERFADQEDEQRKTQLNTLIDIASKSIQTHSSNTQRQETTVFASHLSHMPDLAGGIHQEPTQTAAPDLPQPQVWPLPFMEGYQYAPCDVPDRQARGMLLDTPWCELPIYTIGDWQGPPMLSPYTIRCQYGALWEEVQNQGMCIVLCPAASFGW
ncbi:hypothetical protein BJX62DRAFT_245543 [Aspergillus germanicus]